MKKAIVIVLIFIMLAGAVYSQRLPTSNEEKTATSKELPSTGTQPSLWSKLFGTTNELKATQTPTSDATETQGGDPQGNGKLGLGQDIGGADAPVGVELLSCEDSDGGLSFATPGVVSGQIKRDDGGSAMYYDKCKDSNTLIEYYCNPWTGLAKFHQIYCKSGCEDSADGSRCSTNPFCIDTDSENLPNLKGNLILIKANEEDLPEGSLAALTAQNVVEIMQDYCDPSDSTKVIQYSCDLSVAGYSESSSSCGLGKECLNGRCRIRPASPQGSTEQPDTSKGGGFMGGIMDFFGIGGSKKAVGPELGTPKGTVPDDGSIECGEGEKVIIDGTEITCFPSRLVYAMKFRPGLYQALNINFVDDSADSD